MRTPLTNKIAHGRRCNEHLKGRRSACSVATEQKPLAANPEQAVSQLRTHMLSVRQHVKNAVHRTCSILRVQRCQNQMTCFRRRQRYTYCFRISQLTY